MKSVAPPFLFLLVALLALSCGDGLTEAVDPVPADLEAVGTVPAAAVVGTTLSSTVRVTDASGAAVPGIEVQWSVLGGGGALSASSAVTAGSGEAAVSWRLGTGVGENRLEARAHGVDPVVFGLSTEADVPAWVELSPSLLSFSATGDSTRVSARVEDRYGNRVAAVPITWSCADSVVAEVSAGGWVRALGAGEAEVTATADTAEATLSVRVVPEPASVRVTPAADTITVLGGTLLLTATVSDRNGNGISGAGIEWSSLDPEVATVDGSGTVRAEASGSAVIEAASDGVVGRATVKVQPLAAAVVVTPAADTLDALGATLRLSADVTDDGGTLIDGADVEWTSLAPVVASVTGDGRVTALATGTASIIGSVGGVADTVGILVRQVPASVRVSPTGGELDALGDTLSFTSTVNDANGHAIPGASLVWSSLDPAVATVDANGDAVAVGNGLTTVQASADGVSGEATVEVKQVPARVEVAPVALGTFDSDTVIWVGEDWYQALEAAIYDANGNAMPYADVVWTTSDPAAATVDETDGFVRVQGVREGISTVTGTRGTASGSIAVKVPGKIAFESWRDGNPEIYVMNTDGTRPTNLSNVAAYDTDPVWSPDGSRIAFHSNRDGDYDIYVMNADGTGMTNLTNTATDDQKPAWSPDGSKIAFHSDRDGNYEVYVMNVDGNWLTNLTNNAAIDTEPVWSPDGSKIAFRSDRDLNSEIFVMNADGTDPTNVTVDPGGDYNPVWSPDGSKIAFSGDRDGNYEVYVTNADGTGLANLTNNAANDFGPAWSPDGGKIAFHSHRDGNWEVYVMNADGTGKTNLTNNAAIDENPVWSPDGSKIAFHSLRDGNYEIYVMNADGTEAVKLTDSAGADHLRSWRPSP